MRRNIATTGIILSMFAYIAPAHVSAQDVVQSACITDVYEEIAKEERMYRSVLFGQKKSSDLPQGSVRFSKSGKTWIKTANNSWRTLDDTGLTWSNALMDDEADVPVRRGLFEIRKTPTSDLIPALTQSMRALQCRLRSVCVAAQSSADKEENAKLKVQLAGCIEFEYDVFEGCRGQPATNEVSTGVCDTAVNATLEREKRLLSLVIAYDSAYRSLMQFAGIFEGFMDDFRFPLLQPLWQTARALGSFDGLPCFSAQCDE